MSVHFNSQADSSKHRRRLTKFAIVLGSLVLLIGVFLGTFWNVCSEVDRRLEVFALDDVESVPQLLMKARRLHLGYQIEDWKVPETNEALSEISRRMRAKVDPTDPSYIEVKGIQNFYRVMAICQSSESHRIQEINDLGDDLFHWLACRESLTSSDLEPVFRYLNFLSTRRIDNATQVNAIDSLHDSVGGKLSEDQEVRQFENRIAAFRRRLELTGKKLELSGKTLSGDLVDLDDFNGKIVLLDFWSTTCRPCLRELPELKRLFVQNRSRGFSIIGVPADRFPGKLLDLVDEHEISWSQIWNPEANHRLMEELGIASIPSYVLLDRDGRIISVDVRLTAISDEESLEELLRKIL
ncbi:Thiol-disulfide oxidoreductase ResA [Rubripirellula lacrimiformis]|uniref:Thiol-disulfide oxidoreductase ResA n=1 Tax=Rubripirellula lacrimiformis TaxID=1930273 RepID=A0A517N5E9_9BACT|nr:TlpA disulfide reductase family protein [Rubripirellula lacrimiformis]QDT02366.1 Thiol-disulfide oxidoreductase ResA [Rubripirellula lacrimiformis]